jgi:predicted SAM-dependent methyltransferase
MKINVGSGKQYIPGYVNVDLDESGIADLVAPADALDFVEDGAVSEIVSYHLIEHLGLVAAYRTQAHWALKLKAGGKLVLETPELHVSLQNLAKRKSAGDKDWVFGTGDEGQVHRHPFFKDELIDLLKLIGFTKISVKEPLGYWKRNTIRIEARKGTSDYRAKVIGAWSKLGMDQGTFTSFPFDDLYGSLNASKLVDMTLISPTLALNALEASTSISASRHKTWKKVLDKLDKAGFTKNLYRQLFDYDRNCKDQKKIEKNISKNAGQLILKWLKNGEVDSQQLPFNRKHNKIFDRHGDIIRFFCSHSINEISMTECALGIKTFANKKFKNAQAHFDACVRFNSENTIGWWNLARVEWINGNKENAMKAYDNAFILSKDKNILAEKMRKVPLKIPLEVAYASEI